MVDGLIRVISLRRRSVGLEVFDGLKHLGLVAFGVGFMAAHHKYIIRCEVN